MSVLEKNDIGENVDQIGLTHDTEVLPSQEPQPTEVFGDLETPEKPPVNPNIVDWDGPNDPQNPQNWPTASRWGHVIIVSIITLFANLGATMFAPGASQLMSDFGITGSTLETLSVSIYLLGFAIGPLFIAPMSELYGRLYIYHICNIVALAFTIGCALSTNIGMFLPFRFLVGCTGSAPLTAGGGTVADVIPQEQRGKAMAAWAMGPLLGPVIGPVMGGFITQGVGWRWTFWVLCIAQGTVTIITLIFMRETYGVVLLNRKAARLRKETGNPNLKSKLDKSLSPRTLFLLALSRPTKILFLSPIVLSLSLYMAFVFGAMFLLFTTFSSVFETQYGFTTGTSGLSYLGMGIGMFGSVIVFSIYSDRILMRKAAQAAEKSCPESPDAKPVMKPEYRLPLMVYTCPAIPIGFFWYGWSAQERVHWIVPIFGTLFIGIGNLFVLMPAQVYLVDAFGPQAAASALAAGAVVRILFGAFLPLAGPKMYESLGLGWGNSVLGFISVAFLPLPLLFYRYGEWMRTKWVIQV